MIDLGIGRMSQSWYHVRGGQQVGPETLDDLRRRATAGELQPEDLVWCDGWTDWITARQASELAPAFAPHTADPVAPVTPAVVLAYHTPTRRIHQRGVLDPFRCRDHRWFDHGRSRLYSQPAAWD
jgi:hypothetical protein